MAPAPVIETAATLRSLRHLTLLVAMAAISSLAGCLPGGGSGGEDPNARIDAPAAGSDLGSGAYVKGYMVDGADLDLRDSDVAPDGGQYMLGEVTNTTGPGSNRPRLALLRTNDVGDVLWARTYDSGGSTRGSLADLRNVIETSNGDVWVAGRDYAGQARMLRLDANGELVASLAYGSTDAPVALRALQPLAGGGFVAVGSVPGLNEEAARGDLWLLRADAAGAQVNLRIESGVPRASEVPKDVHVGVDGNITVVGSRDADFFVAHYRSDLTPVFADTYTGITLSGTAEGVAHLPRAADSNVPVAALVAVGRSSGSRTLFINGTQRIARARLVYLAQPDGDQQQDTDIAVPTAEHASYAGVVAFRDANTVLAMGQRDICVEDPRVCAADNPNDFDGIRKRLRAFLQVLSRTPDRGTGGNLFEPERTLDLEDLVPALPPHFVAQQLHRSADGHVLVSGRSSFNDKGSSEPSFVLSLDGADLHLRWMRSLQDLAPRSYGIEAIAPTRDGGVLVATSSETVLRLGPGGDLRWRQDLFPRVVAGNPISVTALSQGGALVTTDAGTVLRYDAAGNIVFARRFPGLALRGSGELDRDGDGLADALMLVGSNRVDGNEALVRLRITLQGELVDALNLPNAGFALGREPERAVTRANGRLLVPVADGALVFDSAGTPVTQWQGADFRDLVATADGALGLLARGGTYAPQVIAALTPEGGVRWAREVRLAPDADGAEPDVLDVAEVLSLQALDATPDGSTTISGSVVRADASICGSRSPLRITDTEGKRVNCGDGLFLRLGPDGALQWQRAYGAQREDGFMRGYALGDNGAIAAGSSVAFAFPRRSLLVTRVDADGEVGAGCVARDPLPVSLAVRSVPLPSLSSRAVTSTPFTPDAEDLPANASAPLTVVTARSCGAPIGTPQLRVNIDGPGRVTNDPGEALRAGIDCGSDCSQRHSTGARVPLLATPSAGARFVGWAADCASAGSQPRATVTMDRDRTCSARFEAGTTTRFNLTTLLEEPTSASGNRVTSTPGGIDCGTGRAGTCSAGFATDTEVRLQAVAGPGQRFAGWTGCDVTDTTSTPLCIVRGGPGDRGDRQVSARFEQVPMLDLRVAISEPAGSTSNRVISFPAAIDCRSGDTGQCSARVPDSVVTVALTAMPALGQRFIGWLGCDSVSTAADPQCFVTVRAGSRTATAQFEAAPDSHEVRVVLAGRPQLDDDGSAATDRVLSNFGGIACDASGSTCSARFPQGTEVRLTLELDPTLSSAGFRSRLDRWDDCDLLEAVDPGQPPVCVLRMLAQDTVVTARVRYVDDESFGGGAPVARFEITGQRAPQPNAVDDPAHFDARGSSVEAGHRIIAYEWDWDANGAYDCAQTEADSSACIATAILPFGVAEHQYTRRGAATVRMRITDDVGRSRELTRTFNVE